MAQREPCGWRERCVGRLGQVTEGSRAVGTSRRPHVALHVSDLCLLCRPQALGRNKDRERLTRGGLHSGVENRHQAVCLPDPQVEQPGRWPHSESRRLALLCPLKREEPVAVGERAVT